MATRTDSPPAHAQKERTALGSTKDTSAETVDDLAVRLLGLGLVLGALAFAFLGWVVVLL